MVLRALGWLNLLDSEKNLSLTNLAVVCLVGKMLLSPNLDWPSITGMVVVFANYMHKRQSTDGGKAAESADQMKTIKAQYEAAVIAQAKTLADLQTKVSSIGQLTDLAKMIARPK